MSRTLERGVARGHARSIHSAITTLEPEPAAPILQLAPSDAKTFSPDVPSAGDIVSSRGSESDPAVMLGFVTLVVACTLFAAVGAAVLWLVV